MTGHQPPHRRHYIVKKIKDGLVKNILFNNIYQIFNLLIPLILAPYISRVLTPTGVGIKSYTNTYVTYFMMIASLGTIEYGTREIARVRDDPVKLSSTFWEIEILTFFSTLASIIGWCFLARFYKEYSFYLWIWTIQIIGAMFNISWFFVGIEKLKYTLSINIIIKILSFVFSILFVKNVNDTWIYILILSVSSLLGCLSTWVFLPKFLVKSKPSMHNIFTRHLKQTFIYFLPSVATSVYTVLDKTLIGIISKNDDYNGFYEQATKIVDLGKVLGFSAINGVVTSRASYLYKLEDKDKIRRLMDDTMNINLFLAIAISFGICAISSVFVPLFFGEGYGMTTQMLYILAPLVFVISLSNTCGSVYFTPSNHRMQSTLFLVIGSVINLFMNILLIYFIGPIGACISTLVAETVISVLYISFCKIITWKKLLGLIWRKLIAGGAMFVLIYLFIRYVSMNHIVLLLISIFGGALVYISLLLLLRDPFFRQIKDYLKEKRMTDKKGN